MNWEAAGAIGEMVGAAGVIVTLGYLAVQIRQGSVQTRLNTKAINAKAFQDLVQHQSTLFLTHVTNPDVRAVILKARSQPLDEFPPHERMVYGACTRMIIRSYFNAFNLLREGLITEDQWATFVPSIVRETTREAFKSFWERAHDDFPQEFAQLIDKAMRSETVEL